MVLYLIDGVKAADSQTHLDQIVSELNQIKQQYKDKLIISLVNKKDQLIDNQIQALKNQIDQLVVVSAKDSKDVDQIKSILTQFISSGAFKNNETIVTNLRHYQALYQAQKAIDLVKQAMSQSLSSDLVAIDLKEALYHLGLITGEVTNDELLGNIFSNFCIGK